MAVKYLHGWIPLAAIITNPLASKFFREQYKEACPTAALTRLASELQASRSKGPEGVELSACGLSVRVAAFEDAETVGSRLNPGFVELGFGGQEEALAAVCKDQEPLPESVTCVIVPADNTARLREVSMTGGGHFRTRLAAVLGVEQARLVRVGKQVARSLHATLEETLSAHACQATAEVRDGGAAKGAPRANKRRCGLDRAPGGGERPQSERGTGSADDDAVTQVDSSVLGKRRADGSVGPKPGGLHPALKKAHRCGDCYAALPCAPEAAALFNARGSILAGVPVYGELLITRTRIAGQPNDDDPPRYLDIPVTVTPVTRVTWLSATLATVSAGLCAFWNRSARMASSLMTRLPRVYEKGATWTGADEPVALLATYSKLFPQSQTSFVALPPTPSQEARADSPAASAPPTDEALQTPSVEVLHRCQASWKRPGQEYVAASDPCATPASAKQQAALDLLHQFLTACAALFAGAGAAAPLPESSRRGSVECVAEGRGALFQVGDAVKGEVQVMAVVGGTSVELERRHINGVVARGMWLAAIEDALLQVRSGAAVVVHTELPLLGHDPTGSLPRVPVAINMSVSSKVAVMRQPRVFNPPLASQRHSLISQLLARRGCHSVVDFGCGEGAWIKAALLAPESAEERLPFTHVIGVDVSPTALNRGKRLMSLTLAKRAALPAAHAAPMQQLCLYQGSVIEGALTDAAGWGAWAACDGALSCEVVEHVTDTDAYAASLLHALRPRVAVVSTPNREYNEVIRFAAPNSDSDPRKPIGADGRPMRDIDHKFEWNRPEFEAWATAKGAQFGYAVAFTSIGSASEEPRWRKEGAGDKDVGRATQLAIFTRLDEGAAAPLASSARGGDIPGADKVFDADAVSKEEVAKSAREYAEMRKEAFREEAAQRSGSAPSGIDDLLLGLSGFGVDDEDADNDEVLD